MAASTAAPRSTPETDRPDPLPMPPSSATTMAGRPIRSLMRLATIPMTPGCQPAPEMIATARLPCPASLASASSRTACSISRRSSLNWLSSMAIARASASSSVVSSRTPRSARPTRPPALMRGPSAKPRSVAVGSRVRRAASIRAARPTLRRAAITFSPCVTKARLSPLSWATSATVPSATMSSRSSRRGSARLANQPRARNVRISAAPSRKATPTAARWPWAAPSPSSSRLGLTIACATGSDVAHLW